jgi:hypothetical protein
MSSRGYSKLAQIIRGSCLTGISIAWLKWTHDTHCIACNSLDYDPDLQHIPVSSVSSHLLGAIKTVWRLRISMTNFALSLFMSMLQLDLQVNHYSLLVFCFINSKLDAYSVHVILSSFTIFSCIFIFSRAVQGAVVVFYLITFSQETGICYNNCWSNMIMLFENNFNIFSRISFAYSNWIFGSCQAVVFG